MKRISLALAATVCASLYAPETAHALTWDWVPHVLQFKNPYHGQDASHYPGFTCMMRNTLGDCVVFNYIGDNQPAKQKNYYRRVSSYGGSGLNFSECQYDDYRRKTAPHTYYTTCDYGTPTTFETGGTQ